MPNAVQRSCWVQGPFALPVSPAPLSFDNILIFASGSNISTALGTVSTWAATRSIYLVWVTRSLPQIEVFLQLMAQARAVFVFHTGPSDVEARRATWKVDVPPNVFIFQGRPPR